MRRWWFIGLVAPALFAAGMQAQQTAPAPGSSQPVGKHPPQARTQPEYNDYNTAYAVKGGEAMEKAADDFAAKYPASELRALLYAKAMQEYQGQNPGKMLAMAEKVLKLDPENLVALVITATVLSDDLSDTDQDRAQKIAEIKKNAGHALQSIDTAFVPPPGTTPEQVTGYKNTLQSMAHSALGITALKSGDDPGAEKELRVAADLSKAQPDPFVWYHLALAQDHQGKYPEALASVNQALQYTGSNPDLGKLAAGERERLVKLTAAPGETPPQSQPSPSPPPL